MKRCSSSSLPVGKIDTSDDYITEDDLQQVKLASESFDKSTCHQPIITYGNVISAKYYESDLSYSICSCLYLMTDGIRHNLQHMMSRQDEHVFSLSGLLKIKSHFLIPNKRCAYLCYSTSPDEIGDFYVAPSLTTTNDDCCHIDPAKKDDVITIPLPLSSDFSSVFSYSSNIRSNHKLHELIGGSLRDLKCFMPSADLMKCQLAAGIFAYALNSDFVIINNEKASEENDKLFKYKNDAHFIAIEIPGADILTASLSHHLLHDIQNGVRYDHDPKLNKMREICAKFISCLHFKTRCFQQPGYKGERIFIPNYCGQKYPFLCLDIIFPGITMRALDQAIKLYSCSK